VPGAPGSGAAGEATAGAAPGATPGVAAAVENGATPAAAAAEARPWVHLREDQPSTYEIRFDSSNRDAWERLRNLDRDQVAQSVKTREVAGVGLEITGLGDGSPAAEFFDVRPGDVLVSIDGRPVQTRADAVSIVEGMDPNRSDNVTVVIDRNGRPITFVVDPTDPLTRRQGRHLELGDGTSVRNP
jgi:hypothetical protein